MSVYSPEIVVWEITYKCNANCIHCGSDCTSVEKPRELTTAECIEVINDLGYIGAKFVILSGGEPLLRKDIGALAAALHQNNVDVGIISNGLAINEKSIKLIKAMNTRGMGLSLDGPTAYMHDYIRGHKGTFDNLIKAIKLLQENNIEPSIVTTIHQLNFPKLPELRDLLISLGVKYWQIQYADYIGRMPRECMLTESQFFELSKFILDLNENYSEEFITASGADVMGYMSEYAQRLQGPWYGCHAGIKALGLGSDGSVRGCLSLQRDEYIEGYTTERPLREIWADPNCFTYNRKFDCSMLSGHCKECIYGAICKAGCLRTATSRPDQRCNFYCLHNIEENGFTNDFQSRKYFSKEEIAELYNKVSPLPQEFYDDTFEESILR